MYRQDADGAPWEEAVIGTDTELSLSEQGVYAADGPPPPRDAAPQRRAVDGLEGASLGTPLREAALCMNRHVGWAALRCAITIRERRRLMSVPNTRSMKRRPTHPGEMLREDFMPDYALSVAGFAEALGVSRQSINELLRERRALSPEMALRLARLFGNSPEFWLNAQRSVDLWDAGQAIKDDVARIKPLRVA